MDISIFLKVTGILISIGLAYWKIKSSRKLKDKTNISLITHTSFPLLTTFQHRFESINIEFTLPVNRNVFYLKGSVLNTGTLDIDKVKIYKPLIISLPQGCKIIECKILNVSSNQIDIQKNVEENKLILSWDLLKPKEHFTFELIIDSESINNVGKLEKSISISHRISDLGKVDTIDLSTVKKTTPRQVIKSSIPAFTYILFFGTISTIGLIFSINKLIKPGIRVGNELVYKANIGDVNIEYVNDSTLKILKEKKVIDQINLNNFEKYITLKPIVTIDRDSYFFIALALLVLGLLTILTISHIKELNGELKKSKIFESLRGIDN
jgi:hypothetical protein